MAEFTDETNVRLKTQLNDTARVPAALVAANVTDAHSAVLRKLDPVYDVDPADDDLVRGETLLAGAYLLRSVASGAAFSARDLRLGDRYIEEGGRHAAMLRMADRFETEAWEVLGPFLLPATDWFQADATPTTEILGEK
jgi:hypothetical protein